MKKVEIVTILDNTNFGTYLQALATGITIKNLGYEVEVLNYIRPHMTSKGLFKGLIKQLGFLRALIRIIQSKPKKTQKLREKDHRFIRNFLPLSQEYQSYNEIKSSPPKADIYLTGSDQVWNSYYNCGLDKTFYLDFAPKNAKRVAYAASIGMEEIPPKEKDKTISLLKKYTTITVREDAAVKLLKKYYIYAVPVLDPTLLLKKENWEQIAESEPLNFDVNDSFILVYSVETRKESGILETLARKISQELNLKIYFVTYNRKSVGFNIADKYFFEATPGVFLNLMLKASFVLVSSFHGTAFAINFNKQFFTVTPKKFNSRTGSLLRLTHLENRAVSSENLRELDFSKINYELVNSKLNKERASSIGLLQEMLNDNN